MDYRDVKTVMEADVIVFGAGPGGLGAAVTAARNGARTVVVERNSMPGGMAVQGEVHPFMPNHVNGKTLDRPVYTEWAARLQAYAPDGEPDPEAGAWRSRMIGIPEAALAAEDLLLEAGVKPVYHHHLLDAEVRDGQIQRAILFSKSGLTAVKAGICIDCTGDADLAARAGCPVAFGNEDGFCQPMTLCFKLEGVDGEKLDGYAAAEGLSGGREVLNRCYDEARRNGEVECPRENILMFSWFKPDVLHFNTTRVVKHSAIDGLELSDAEVAGRRQVRQLLAMLRARVPGFEKARLRSMAAHIGVRESRRILGRAFLGLGDFDFERSVFPSFPDAIARVSYDIDIHNPTGSGTLIRRFPAGAWYEIPYGCIVPQGIDNLLVGGRPISVDHAVHSSMRVMPSACSVGQAAGMAAAMCVAESVLPPALDGVRVRERLRVSGAAL